MTVKAILPKKKRILQPKSANFIESYVLHFDVSTSPNLTEMVTPIGIESIM